jgi:hypothetical protein
LVSGLKDFKALDKINVPFISHILGIAENKGVVFGTSQALFFQFWQVR